MPYSFLFICCWGLGDWGLGIGQSPIPNPQSPVIANNVVY